MKKIFFGLVIIFSLAFAYQVIADDNITLNIDNNAIESDVPPQIIDGRTMVPVRAIFEGVGAEVEWNAENKTITGVMSGINVVMTLDSNIATVNGVDIEMDCSPIIVEGRTLAPARYVAEAFGCSVEWDNNTKSVNIATPMSLVQITTIEETTVETTTETTTVIETTTNPMYNYDTYYASGTYLVGTDMPVGEYVVFANPDRIGYLYKYARDGNVSTTTGKRYLYNKYFSYCDVIKVTNGNYLDLSNAYAIPSADVEKMDASRNGTFRAGKDIKTGHLTFKLSPECNVGYINIGIPDASNADKTIEYLTSENDSVTVNVTSGMYVRIFGCDILDEKLSTIYTYTPLTNDYVSTSTLNIADVTPSLKQNVDSFLTTLINDLTYDKFKSTKYTENYQNKIKDNWNSLAVSSADKRYVALANEAYTHIRVYAKDTNSDIAGAVTISMNSQQISGSKYRDILKNEKDYFTRVISGFKNGASFRDLEVANKLLAYYRYDVPRLGGYKVN